MKAMGGLQAKIPQPTQGHHIAYLHPIFYWMIGDEDVRKVDDRHMEVPRHNLRRRT